MDEKEIRELEKKILSVEQTVLLKVTSLEIELSALHETVKTLVTKERFDPVAYIAYGLAAGVLTTALGAVLSKIFIE
jgi:hypothetical protein